MATEITQGVDQISMGKLSRGCLSQAASEGVYGLHQLRKLAVSTLANDDMCGL